MPLQYYRTLNVRVILVSVITWSKGDKINPTTNTRTLLDHIETFRPQVAMSHDALLYMT